MSIQQLNCAACSLESSLILKKKKKKAHLSGTETMSYFIGKNKPTCMHNK